MNHEFQCFTIWLLLLDFQEQDPSSRWNAIEQRQLQKLQQRSQWFNGEGAVRSHC